MNSWTHRKNSIFWQATIRDIQPITGEADPAQAPPVNSNSEAVKALTESSSPAEFSEKIVLLSVLSQLGSQPSSVTQNSRSYNSLQTLESNHLQFLYVQPTEVATLGGDKKSDTTVPGSHTRRTTRTRPSQGSSCPPRRAWKCHKPPPSPAPPGHDAADENLQGCGLGSSWKHKVVPHS